MDFLHESSSQRVVARRGGAALVLAEEIARLGSRRVALIAGRRIGPTSGLTRGIPVALRIDRVVEHVPRDLADETLARVVAAGCDAIVAIGGGSAVGLGKAVARGSGLPFLVAPTTYAGSEATPVWGVTAEGRKVTGHDEQVLPGVVVYDAELSRDLPLDITVASGVNAIAHGVDALWAPRSDPISAVSATDGIRLLAESLRRLRRDPGDMDARERMLLGTYLASSAFGRSGAGLHHKICHVLGGSYGLPHAATHAVVLPHVIAFTAPSAPEAEARIADALGAESAIAGIAALVVELGAPSSLRELGLAESDLEEAARLVAEVAPPGPVAVAAPELAALLRRAWAGGLDPRTLPADERQAVVERDVLSRVLASFAHTPDPRLRALMSGLVTHLHAFVRETRLTEGEWNAAIAFLTDVGRFTDDRRQEFILLSDVLGISMQTVAVGNPVAGASTEATVFGPFFVEEAPRIVNGGDITAEAAGEPCWVEGTVRRLDGSFVPGARIEVWEADEDGLYDVQYGDDRIAGRAHLFTDDEGGYAFWGMTPTPYPIPHDGPVGALLRATRRSPFRAPHLHFMVTAPGARTLITHIFVKDGEHLDDDSVFGVKESLVLDFVRQPVGSAGPDGRDLGERSWTRVRFDIVLADA